jgi:hypothetical protein
VRQSVRATELAAAPTRTPVMNENNAIDQPHSSPEGTGRTFAAFWRRNNLSLRTDKNMGENR